VNCEQPPSGSGCLLVAIVVPQSRFLWICAKYAEIDEHRIQSLVTFNDSNVTKFLAVWHHNLSATVVIE
jgi:hypothetical protein